MTTVDSDISGRGSIPPSAPAFLGVENLARFPYSSGCVHPAQLP